jgi:hypothetical protein
MRPFRSELERGLQHAEVTILYDLAACERLARLSPRIDPLPVSSRKLHAKVTVQLWSRPQPGENGGRDRRLRLVVGSANLTRQGFRENYECVAALDFGGRDSAPPLLLQAALAFLREVSAETTSAQSQAQLAEMEREAARLPPGQELPEAPLRFVPAEEVAGALRDAWAGITSDSPVMVQLVSPFWPEGERAGEALAGLVRSLGTPSRVEVVCRGVAAGDGKTWVPEFDPQAALDLRERLGCAVALRVAWPDQGVQQESGPDAGDETEDEHFSRLGSTTVPMHEIQRALHAKMIVLSGPKGTALYVGSSNCTRRGIGLTRPGNWEAGFVYRLVPKRDFLSRLLAFAGPALEVMPGGLVPARKPEFRAPRPAPLFLSEVTVAGGVVRVRFRDGVSVPTDLRILMQDAAKEDRYWLLYRATDHSTPGSEYTVDLTRCPRCDATESVILGETSERPIPHVEVEVRWQGLSVQFPVRFENKLELPLLLLGRRPSEGELIEYFLFGREPGESEEENGMRSDTNWGGTDDPLDTRRILAYFMRRFVQAIPGIESEVGRAAYSRPALEAALKGPTSPLALAEHAAGSLSRTAPGEPTKTPTAVAFQLVEILAALGRCRSRVTDPDLQACFTPVTDRCRELLDGLVAAQRELQDDGFRRYRLLIAEGVR